MEPSSALISKQTATYHQTNEDDLCCFDASGHRINITSSITTLDARSGKKGMTIKAVFFDFMGTCLNWHASIVAALSPFVSEHARSQFALSWRQNFFDRLSARHGAGEMPEDVDTTFYEALVTTAKDPQFQQIYPALHSVVQPDSSLIQAWHRMRAWTDVGPALEALRASNLELFVLANGTTRLQLDLVRSAGLHGMFDMLFSSQMLGVYKPSCAAYLKALNLVGCNPEEAVMVACHAYDLRAARDVGMNTVYVRRWTDDVNEDMQQVEAENPGTFLSTGFADVPIKIATLSVRP